MRPRHAPLGSFQGGEVASAALQGVMPSRLVFFWGLTVLCWLVYSRPQTFYLSTLSLLVVGPGTGLPPVWLTLGVCGYGSLGRLEARWDHLISGGSQSSAVSGLPFASLTMPTLQRTQKGLSQRVILERPQLAQHQKVALAEPIE